MITKLLKAILNEYDLVSLRLFPRYDNLSTSPAAVATDMHVTIQLVLLVAASVAVLALVARDFSVEKWKLCL